MVSVPMPSEAASHVNAPTEPNTSATPPSEATAPESLPQMKS